MTDIAAAIGIEQLAKAEGFREKREAIAHKYTAAFADLDFLSLPGTGEMHAWHLYMIRIKPDRLSISRDEFIDKLSALGIGTSVHFIPLHIMPYYKRLYGFSPSDFPVSLAHFESSISLPVYPDLGDEQLARVIDAIQSIGRACYAHRVLSCTTKGTSSESGDASGKRPAPDGAIANTMLGAESDKIAPVKHRAPRARNGR